MSSDKTGNPPEKLNFDSFVQLYKQMEKQEFDNEYSDEDVVKWSSILRTIQENGLGVKATNRLTQVIARLFGSDVQPLPLEEVEAIMHERGLEPREME